MDKEQDIPVNKKIKNGAKIVLILMLLIVIGELGTTYQAQNQLVSPLIPESLVWDVNKQFVFQAMFFAFVSLVGLLLYFFEKYLYVIFMFIIGLVVSRFIYV